MTGFGRGEVCTDGKKISIQINSINRKQTEIRVLLPKDLICFDKTIRDKIKNVVSRGAITAKLELDSGQEDSACPSLNVELAQSIYKELKQLQKELNLDEPVSLSNLLNIPDLSIFQKPNLPIGQLSELIDQAMDSALEVFMTTKKEEGNTLLLDIKKRHQHLLDILDKIKTQAPNVPIQYREKIVVRINEHADIIPVDDDRLLKEIALFADRCDISEEVTRISSHLGQMAKFMKVSEPVGRKLDFLIQEIFREINTIGAKANDFEISTLVIDFKAELERIREQAQNIE